MTEKGQEGGDRNVCFDFGSGYTGVYICQNPLDCTLNMDCSLLYINYYSTKWMLSKKKDLTSLIIRKIQTKITVRCYFIPIRIAIIKKEKIMTVI